MDDHERIDLIIDWAEDKDFDLEFIYKLKDRLEHYGTLTDGQSGALEDIIDKYGIES